MINLTILSLASIFMTSNSPAFVSNHLSCSHSNFNHFFSTIFYNQETLIAQQTRFLKGLSIIVHNEKQDNYLHETFEHLTQSKPLIIEQNPKRSVSIIDCYFSNISGLNIIFISTDQVSLYITSTTFLSCISKDGVIFLQRARCLTMTHVCSASSGTRELYGIMNVDSADEDNVLCLYSSFVDSTSRTEDSSCIIRSIQGNQYFKCINMTNTISSGFRFDTPQYLTFSMVTAINIGYRCLELIGYTATQCNRANDKEIEYVNFISNGYQMMKLSSGCEFTLTISNSFLMNSNNSPDFYITENEFKMNVVVQFSYVLDRFGDGESIEFLNCTKVSSKDENLTDFIVLYPHYTYENVCDGSDEYDEKFTAYGCNNGKCLDNSCEKTVGFPEYVVPYTTIHHADIHIPTSNTFYPTKYFTASETYTQSQQFSPSKTIETEIITSEKQKPSSDKDKISYIIESFSHTIVASYIENVLGKKKKISEGDLIGIVCGSVGGVFLIAGIVVVIYNRKNRIYSGLSSLEDTSEEDEQENIVTRNNIDLESINPNKDNWL